MKKVRINIARSPSMRVHYIVANQYEGCAHRHTSAITALPCLKKLGLGYHLYRITYSRRKNRWVRKWEKM